MPEHLQSGSSSGTMVCEDRDSGGCGSRGTLCLSEQCSEGSWSHWAAVGPSSFQFAGCFQKLRWIQFGLKPN